MIAPEPVGVGGDASFYHSAANLIAQGHFYDRRIFGHTYPTALHPPLFSLLLTPVALLGGVHVLPQRIVGCVLGAVNVVLIWQLAKRLSGPRAALAAAAIAVVYPPLVTADGALQSEPLYILLLLIALLLTYELLAAATLSGALLLGAVLGLATLTRTEALLLMALLALPALRSPPGAAAARIAACALVLTPWLVRNVVVFHKLMLAGNYDTVVAAANCHETYYGHDIGWWSIRCLRRARTRRQLLIGDASPAAGLRYARRHPGRAILVAGVRVLRTFSFFQPLRIGRDESRRRWFDVLGLAMYYPLLALAAIGLARGARSQWPLLAPILTTVVVGATGWETLASGSVRTSRSCCSLRSRWRGARTALRRSGAREAAARYR